MDREKRSSSQGIDLKSLRIQQILDGKSEDRVLIDTLKAQLEAVNLKLQKKEAEIKERDRTIESFKDELSASRTGTGASRSSMNPEEIVRRKHCRALGLDPNFAQELTSEQIRQVVNSAYRTYSRLFAVDLGGNLERQVRINNAHDYFVPKKAK